MSRRLSFELLTSRKRGLVFCALLLAGAVYLRLHLLGQLPPGVNPIEASFGLKAHGPMLLPLKQIQQILAVWSARLAQHFIKNPILALRLSATLASLVGIGFFYGWLERLFGRRTAYVGAFLASVTPWALNLSRFGAGYGMALLAISLSLYLLTLAWQKPTPARIFVAFAISSLGFYTDPIYNWYALALAVVAVFVFPQIFKGVRRAKLSAFTIGILIFLLIAAPASPAIVAYFGNVARSLPHNILSALGSTAAIFNVKAPIDYSFNLFTLPLLNAFVGLMLILGFLAALGGVRLKHNRALLGLFLVALLPAVLLFGRANLGDRAVILLWPALALAAVGIDYLSTQWLRTFPQNSAARNLGSLMIAVLLLLTIRQGYNQYFLAWPASSQTKLAFKTQSIRAINFFRHSDTAGAHYFVGDEDDLTIARFLSAPGNLIGPENIDSLGGPKENRQFVIAEGAKNAAIKALAKKFKGGKLTPNFDKTQTEQFLVYEVKG